MNIKFSSFFAALIVLAGLGSIGFAQEAKINDKTVPVERHGGERFGKMRGSHHQDKMLRVFSELDLTDSQKQQITTIIETNKTITSPQREELKQLFVPRRNGAELTAEQTARAREVGSQLRDASQKMKNDLLLVLTPEQQEKLKQKQAEMRERHRERRQLRQQNKESIPSSNN